MLVKCTVSCIYSYSMVRLCYWEKGCGGYCAQRGFLGRAVSELGLNNSGLQACKRWVEQVASEMPPETPWKEES